MKFVGYAFSVLAVLLAWALTRRRFPEHRTVAWLLTAGLAIDILTLVLRVTVFGPLGAELGYSGWTGWARHAAVVANGLNLAWPAALVAAALVVFAGRSAWLAALGWLGAVVAYGLIHPVGDDQAHFLALVQAAAVLVSAGLGVMWYRRPGSPATPAHLTLIVIVAAELSSLLGAWTHGVFGVWPITQALYLAWYGAVILIQGRFLWSRSAQPSS